MMSIVILRFIFFNTLFAIVWRLCRSIGDNQVELSLKASSGVCFLHHGLEQGFVNYFTDVSYPPSVASVMQAACM